MNTKATNVTYFINGQGITSINPDISMALQYYLTSEQQQQSFAVALNGDFVGKAYYQKTIINPGDSIDVLFPIQGG
ncbi:sulfur carrier protein ThiS [Colwellia hornerae]|uniref:Sulfur carrier protein ThiS n=1 Tax=Colwellia hornerae TaxID=89402 RepID=A0A5C6QKA3_9GAMM|nr:sulfur carrier protein ThiS [Colwellia hornerae]TWX58537.1 sulfur carrier protein ThiS [Colwellia hornerae]TWX59603.1 sulfur carrier protein ThiS [Colwellia hornerae]TWX69329.1 sulfur carrier protein ThiS [Colwellia hornerae]